MWHQDTSEVFRYSNTIDALLTLHMNWQSNCCDIDLTHCFSRCVYFTWSSRQFSDSQHIFSFAQRNRTCFGRLQTSERGAGEVSTFRGVQKWSWLGVYLTFSCTSLDVHTESWPNVEPILDVQNYPKRGPSQTCMSCNASVYTGSVGWVNQLFYSNNPLIL